jgi:ABC-type branched-subunit amino acid transport system substrate-binding protein
LTVAGALKLSRMPVTLAACFWALGCNVVVDTSTEQCETDADCSAKGPAFAGTFCTTDKVCGALACTSSRQCSARLGEPGYCRPDSTCTKVLTDDCTEIVPQDALKEDEVILAGFMGPVKEGHPNQSYGLPLRQGAELALTEIESVANGLPGIEGSGQRHLAMLVCHDNENERAVARHLAQQVRVPVIIGPSFSGVTIRITTDVTIPARVLALSPSATSPEISGLDDRGLVWRTAPSDEIQAEALAKLLQETEKALALGATVPLRVAYTVRDDSYGKGISEAFIRKVLDLKIKSNAQVQEFRAASYKPDGAETDESITDSVAQSVAEAEPHIVLGFGTNEFATKVLPKIEARLSADAPRPRYLIPEGVRVTELVATVKARTDLKQRILGTAPGARQSQSFTAFSRTFLGQFKETPGNLAEFAYDAAYLFAYATGISRKRSPTGSELALALKSVSCKDAGGLKITAGGAFNESFNNAVTKPCVDFEGASGPLDFNNDTGEAPSDIALWYLDASASFRALQHSYYNASDRKLVDPADATKAPCPWSEVEGSATCE